MSSLLTLLYDFTVSPLIYLVELVFIVLYRLLDDPGLAIVGVSLVVNLLCLPLYRMADRLQEEERLRQEDMSHWVNHIKRHFSGDEQYMILTMYYREKGYKPIQALNSSISLLLQIPIFMAAYSCLSNLPVLRNSSFLFINDLSKPDALLTVGGFVINVLPVAMTLLNCLATVIYTRGLGLRDKIQAYGLALVFLVLLYQSPSGLVLYWTLNQIFSVVKNIVLPRGTDVGKEQTKAIDESSSARTFVLAALLITVLAGCLIPSALIAASTTEFINVYEFVNPLRHIINTTAIVGGFVLLWVGVFFYLSKERGRRVFAFVLTACAAAFLVDYFLFGQNLGVISDSLIFDDAPSYSLQEILVNLLAIAAAVGVVTVTWKLRRSLIDPALVILLIAIVGLSVPNVSHIFSVAEKTKADIRIATAEALQAQEKQALEETEEAAEEETVAAQATEAEADEEDVVQEASHPAAHDAFFDAEGNIESLFTLSREGKNVVVIFLDRAIGGYIPYIVNEKPELKESLDGFVFYPNTISFGRFTNFGTPGLYGGYDYSVEAINARSDVSLKDKQNEALQIMPRLFSDAGYEITLLDPPYVDYQFYSGDLSLFNQIDNVKAYNITGRYTSLHFSEFNQVVKHNFKRNLCFYSLFKVSPVAIQPLIYNGGTYFSSQVNHSVRGSFIDNYSAIISMKDLTNIDASVSNNVLIMSNSMTHEPDVLQMPDYVPSTFIDNRQFEDPSVFSVDGRTMVVGRDPKNAHYHTNMAALLRLGEWFDYLREQDVYDNTRIIIVSDHGRWLKQFSYLLLFDGDLDVESVNPLLMVKDFDAHGFTVDNSFMTNADTPVIAFDGLIDNPVNPFTGNPIDSSEKTSHVQLVTTSENWNLESHNETTFDTSDGEWYTVHDDIFDQDNWELVE